MLKLRAVVARICRREEGQVLILFAAAFTLVCGAIAMAIDVGKIVYTKSDLQKVADAAAFAGAQDLPSSGSATEMANTYVGLNAADTTAVVEVGGLYNPNDSIRVTATREVKFSFLQVLGIEGTEVEATAVVRVGTYNGGNGLLPWGLVASDEEDFLANACFDGFDGDMPEFKQNVMCTLKYGAGENNGGDFGIVALDGTGSEAYEDAIINGSKTSYKVGDLVEPQTGANVGKSRSGLNARLAKPLPEDCQTHSRDEILHTDSDGKTSITGGCETHPRIIIIPVLDKIDNPNMSTILGFAFMYLHGVSGSGGHMRIQAEFVTFVTAIPGGTYTGEADGTSSTAIMLIE